MTTNLLILGGTTEASALCQTLANRRITATVSFAGRVAKVKPQAIPMRVGGFGGPRGLINYINTNNITHLIDATHPFAAQMSRNALAACAETATPMVALTRPSWTPKRGDSWQTVPDIARCVQALSHMAAKRIMLAVGRMHLPEFSAVQRHFYLLRLVDQPKDLPEFKDVQVEVSRGPFSTDDDIALMKRHAIDLVVSKNAGGTGSVSKLTAARTLGVPVLMVDRPALPLRTELTTIADVLTWLDHTRTDLGV